MTPEEIEEVNKSLWEELDKAKAASGYTVYLESRKGLHHWTFEGYLKNLYIRASQITPVQPNAEVQAAGRSEA